MACFVISPRGPCPSHINKMICVLNIFLFQQSALASRADFWVWYWMVLVWRFADWEHFCYESHKEHMNIYSKNSQHLTNLGQICQNTFWIPQLWNYENYYKIIVEEFVCFFPTMNRFNRFSVYQKEQNSVQEQSMYHLKKNCSDDFILFYLDLFHLNLDICEEAREWAP